MTRRPVISIRYGDEQGRYDCQVDQLVELGSIDPEHVITPGIFVQHVVATVGTTKTPRGNLMQNLTRQQIAWRVAQDIAEGLM